MDFTNRLKTLYFSVITSMSKLPPKSDPQFPPSPPPLSAILDLELAAERHVEPDHSLVAAGHRHLDWAKIIVAFCLTSGIEITLQSSQSNSKLSPCFHFITLAISFAVASLFASRFIGSKYTAAAHVLYRTGVFFAATAFFLAITIPFPTSLKCTTWTLYTVSMIAVIISNCV